MRTKKNSQVSANSLKRLARVIHSNIPVIVGTDHNQCEHTIQAAELQIIFVHTSQCTVIATATMQSLMCAGSRGLNVALFTNLFTSYTLSIIVIQRYDTNKIKRERTFTPVYHKTRE